MRCIDLDEAASRSYRKGNDLHVCPYMVMKIGTMRNMSVVLLLVFRCTLTFLNDVLYYLCALFIVFGNVICMKDPRT